MGDAHQMIPVILSFITGLLVGLLIRSGSLPPAKIVAERAKTEAEHAQQISGMERDVAVARTQLEMDRAYLDKAKTDAEIGYEQI
jgi:hypothetical protein